MIVSKLSLSVQDLYRLRVSDAYSIHRIVYSLFADVRDAEQKEGSTPSGFLYADKGHGNVIILSDRALIIPDFGCVESKEVPEEFLNFDFYRFEVIVNATKRDSKTSRLVPVVGHENICNWFSKKSLELWGFSVVSNLQVTDISVVKIRKKDTVFPLQRATVQGILKVVDRQKFINSFSNGIGRGKAFGCGLLQIVPIQVDFIQR